MTFIKISTALLVTLLLSACATAPKFQTLQPHTNGMGAATLSESPVYEKTDHISAYLNKEKSQLYSQNFGGGGAALGLLLGPIGVAANINMIEKVTIADAEQMRDKISVNPQEIFVGAAKQSGFDLATNASGPQPKVIPYLYLMKAEADVIYAAAGLAIQQGEGTEKWRGQYTYQLPYTYSVRGLSELDAVRTDQLRNGLSAAFAKLLEHLKSEQPEKFAKEQKITFRSPFLFPRLDADMPGTLIEASGDTTWIRTFGGVYAIPKANIKYTVQKS